MYTIIPIWTFKKDTTPEQRLDAIEAIRGAAPQILKTEPGTLAYLVHTVESVANFGELITDADLDQLLVFYEVYRDQLAFEAHLYGPIFTHWQKKYGGLFLQDASGGNVVRLLKLSQLAGFVRASSALNV